MTNLDTTLKCRDITLPTKFRLVKAMVFPVVMYGCESWTMEKSECRRIDAFELWYWRGLLRVPWTARRSNQSILKEISPGCSLEGLMLRLKLQYFGHLMQRTDSLEKTLMLGKIEGGRRRDDRGWKDWTASPTPWTWVWISFACCGPWGHKESEMTEWLNWTERGTKEPVDEDKRGEWKSWLKTQHSKNRSWHPVPSLHGSLKSGSSDKFYSLWFQSHCGQWLQP